MTVEETFARIEELHTLLKLFDVPYLIMFDYYSETRRYFMVRPQEYDREAETHLFYSMEVIEYQVNRLSKGFEIMPYYALPPSLR